MNARVSPDGYGEVVGPLTLQIQRIMPGPIERIWSYLTDSDLRRQWLAAGDMDLKAGAPFTLTWRNDELNDPPSKRPEGFSQEHSLDSEIVEVDPPHKLVFTWGQGEVTFELTQLAKNVLLTVTHARISNRENMLMVGAGWHMHLDILVARATGQKPDPFWDGWKRLRDEYDRRLPA